MREGRQEGRDFRPPPSGSSLSPFVVAFCAFSFVSLIDRPFAYRIYLGKGSLTSNIYEGKSNIPNDRYENI